MAPGSFRFERFFLDPQDRLLRRDDAPVALNARYLDALALLVREQGKLVSKDRFLDEVWRGVPVTDEALTQCIRTLRRELGDDAARPRFIETVPKHGYRFVAPVQRVEAPAAAEPTTRRSNRSDILRLGLAGAGGSVLAGLLGGVVYGFAGASEPLQPGMGAISVLLVLVCLTMVVALLGGAAVAFGIAAADALAPRRRRGPAMVLGGALGGLLIGAVVKLLGVDAFNLLFGQSPGDVTGASEGALLGAAVGFGAWFAGRSNATPSARRGFVAGGLAGAAAGLAIALTGGRLLGGSLALLTERFPNSRLRLDHLGGLAGEPGFGPLTHALTGALEGLLFGAFLVGAMTLPRSPKPQESLP
ncbi:transcriptional regulator [Phenylobacterium sp.]|uniref:winged helix-turn-helix domain-containing protein n=1 Tax=Phenylobacterium sp. TaxID=1871053 RepID=UPI0028115E40|nr:transcriptional regulator [Phenylobacterium sp.]